MISFLFLFLFILIIIRSAGQQGQQRQQGQHLSGHGKVIPLLETNVDVSAHRSPHHFEVPPSCSNLNNAPFSHPATAAMSVASSQNDSSISSNSCSTPTPSVVSSISSPPPSLTPPYLPRRNNVEPSQVASSAASKSRPHSLNMRAGGVNTSMHAQNLNRLQGNVDQKRRLLE